MRQLYALARRAAGSRLSVLIVGETGAGKEVLAHCIHEWSPRSAGPLRSINSGSLPANLVEAMFFGHEKGAFTGALQDSTGFFEQASGGTLFLDEIGELSLAAQVALLRVLETRRVQAIGASQEREVDVRVIAATNQDLEQGVGNGRFRLDLLYRLNAVTLRIPPLRDRRGEIPHLVHRFLQNDEIPADAPRQISSDAMARLVAYSWPGNIRELRNVVQAAAVTATGSRIEIEDLPERLHGHSNPPAVPTRTLAELSFGSSTASLPSELLRPSCLTMRERLAAYEAELIRAALRETAGHKSNAAKLLNMPLRTFMKRLKVHGVQ